MADIVKLIYKGDEMAQWGWGSAAATNLNVTEIGQYSQAIHVWETKTISYTVDKPGFITVWSVYIYDQNAPTSKRVNTVTGSSTWWEVVEMSRVTFDSIPVEWWAAFYTTFAVPAWTFTLTGKFRNEYAEAFPQSDKTFTLELEKFFYFS